MEGSYVEKIFKALRLINEKLKEKNITPSAAAENAKKILEKDIKPGAAKYLISLALMLLVVVFAPAIFTIPGILLGSKTLIVIGGSMRALFTAVLAMLAAPIGILLEMLIRGRTGGGERYVKFVVAICVSELFFTLVVCFVPLRNNADMIAPFILGALILGFLNAWLFQPKIVASVTGIIFVGIIASFFFPFSSGKIGADIGKIDRKFSSPRSVRKSCEELREEGIFWSQDGKNKYWYHVDVRSGEFRLYEDKGVDIIDRDSLKPFESETLHFLCRQEKKQASFTPAVPTKVIPYVTPTPAVLPEYKPENLRKNPYILNPEFVNRNETTEIAVVIVNNRSQLILDDSKKIASIIQSDKIISTGSLVSPGFVSDGQFERSFQGKGLNSHRFADYIDYFLLGKKIVTREYDNTFKKDLFKIKIDARIISSLNGSIVGSFVAEGESFDTDFNRACHFADGVAMKDLKTQLLRII